MTTQEFSNGFDTLLNSYATQNSIQAIALDEYEKSVFLTEAQESIVLAYYKGASGADAFETTEEVRRYLSSLVKTSSISPLGYTSDVLLSDNSFVVNLPSNLWFITYEAVRLSSGLGDCLSGKIIEVVPVTQDWFHRTVDNPFRGPTDRRALRLDLDNNRVEIVSKYNIDKYIVRYVEKLQPIILETLTDGLSIDGNTQSNTCQLHEALHKVILQQAVTLALRSRGLTREQTTK